MEFKKKYNRIRETMALKASNKARKKRFKNIIEDLGDCQISLKDIANGDKTDGFLYLLDKNGATFDEMVVLQQYSKAIIDRDTKSAEFLRDSSGQKPSTTVDLNDNRSGLSQMSIEELEEMRDLMRKQVNKEE